MNPADLPLRDIHLPPSPGWWPPAPGWWLLAALLLAAAVFALLLWRRHRSHRLRRTARRQLDGLHAAWRAGPDHRALATGVSELLRRTSLSLLPRGDIAGLTGREWLAALDALSPQAGIGSGASGRALLEAPYQASPNFDAEALIEAAGRWIDGLAPPRGTGE